MEQANAVHDVQRWLHLRVLPCMFRLRIGAYLHRQSRSEAEARSGSNPTTGRRLYWSFDFWENAGEAHEFGLEPCRRRWLRV